MTSNIDKLFDNEGKPIFVVVIGRSMLGKSHLVRYLLTDRFTKGKLKFGLVFSKTKFNNDYDIFPDKSRKEGYNEDILIKYMNNLKKIREKNGVVPPNVIIFDDLAGILANSTDYFTNFIATCRHFNTSIFICVQYLTGRNAITPLMREQASHCIMFKSRTRRTLENLYDSFCGLFQNYDDFKDYFMNATTEKYTAMLYLQAIDELDDNYITIQAPKDYKQIKIDY